MILWTCRIRRRTDGRVTSGEVRVGIWDGNPEMILLHSPLKTALFLLITELNPS